jgi:hypothetical protein
MHPQCLTVYILLISYLFPDSFMAQSLCIGLASLRLRTRQVLKLSNISGELVCQECTAEHTPKLRTNYRSTWPLLRFKHFESLKRDSLRQPTGLIMVSTCCRGMIRRCSQHWLPLLKVLVALKHGCPVLAPVVVQTIYLNA